MFKRNINMPGLHKDAAERGRESGRWERENAREKKKERARERKKERAREKIAKIGLKYIWRHGQSAKMHLCSNLCVS